MKSKALDKSARAQNAKFNSSTVQQQQNTAEYSCVAIDKTVELKFATVQRTYRTICFGITLQRLDVSKWNAKNDL